MELYDWRQRKTIEDNGMSCDDTSYVIMCLNIHDNNKKRQDTIIKHNVLNYYIGDNIIQHETIGNHATTQFI